MNKIIRVNRQKLARLDRRIELPRARFKGRFRIQVRREDGSVRLEHEFDNIITNGGLDAIGNAGGYLSNCYVGTGNSTPVVTDTALDAQIASTNSIVATSGSVQPSSPYYGTRQNTYQFAQGAAAGNVAEVGVGPSGTNLFSRALILNGGGSPTTITVLSNEFLDVTYILQMYPDVTDQTGTVTINSVVYNYTARCMSVTGAPWTPSSAGDQATANSGEIVLYSGVIGAITATSPGGTPSGCTTSNASYTGGSYTRQLTGSASLAQANFTVPPGVQSMGWGYGSAGNLGAYQIGLADGSGNGVPKTSSQVMTLTASVTWASGI